MKVMFSKETDAFIWILTLWIVTNKQTELLKGGFEFGVREEAKNKSLVLTKGCTMCIFCACPLTDSFAIKLNAVSLK